MNRKRIRTDNIFKKIKKCLFLAIGILFFAITGCGGEQQEESVSVQVEDINEEDTGKKQIGKEKEISQAEAIAALYRDIYDKAVEGDTLGGLEVMQGIIGRLGKGGYAAVDERNLVNMVKADQVMQFVGLVDAKAEGKLTILVVTYTGGFKKYDLYTVDGEVNVTKEYYEYINGYLKNLSTVNYAVNFWQYTEEGYLLFEGDYFSESNYVLMLSGVSEHTALRVQPLDETCRELNRRYILPVGYEKNNLFLTEWSEDDFGELDFYDLFDRLYSYIYGNPVPYPADDDLSSGAVYWIPADLFETVIQKYLEINIGMLQKKTVYIQEENAYEYRPRGFYETEYPDIPYPEVENYKENNDGTITLTVNAVYPKDNTSKAYTHEVVIRPLSDGGFQYISNHMVPPGDTYEAWWRSERLTEGQWKELYEGEK